jgi:hypothetical protein
VISVSMAAVIGAPRERVWSALTSPQELIHWDDRMVMLAQGADPGVGRRARPRQRYRLGSVCVDLRYRPLEVVPLRRLRSKVSLGLFRFEAIYTLSKEDGDPRRTRLSLRLAFSNSVPVVGGCVDRFDLRRLASQLVAGHIYALQCWCESRPAAGRTQPPAPAPRPAAKSGLRCAAPRAPSGRDPRSAGV